jgi:hypothetical protein
MSMAEIMREVASLPPKQQDELAAYLLHLRLQHDDAWREEMDAVKEVKIVDLKFAGN